MSALGKWLNRPRKRSQSSPTRQILSDFLNRPAPEIHQPTTSPPDKSQQLYKLSSTHAGHNKNNASTPMLITSSFYNLAYPFDQNDSSPDEEEYDISFQKSVTKYHTTSKPLIPSSSKNDSEKQQVQQHDINKQVQPKTVLYVQNRTPPTLSEPPHPLQLVETPINNFGSCTDALDIFDECHSRQSVTWARPDLAPLQPKRKPTPYADEGFYFEDDKNAQEHGVYASSEQNGKAFTASPTAYNAEFERLRTEIKKLEKTQKKHKRRELRMHQQMLDTQQQLDYLILSRSCESNRPYSYNQDLSSSYMSRNSDQAAKAASLSSTNYQFLPSQHQQRESYWYNSYGGDYYYSRQTPYQSHQLYDYHSSSEPEDYYQEHNEYDRNMSASLPSNFTNNTHSRSAAIPISKYYNQHSKSLDDYYFHQSQRYHYDYSQHDNPNSHATMIPKNSSKNKKRWTQ